MIDFYCPHCGEMLQVPSSLAGQTENCPICHKPSRVPTGRPGSPGRYAPRIPPTPSHQGYYYCRGGQQRGPVDMAELNRMAATGELRPDDLIWTEDMAQWVPASTLIAFFRPTMPPPSPYAWPGAMPNAYGSQMMPPVASAFPEIAYTQIIDAVVGALQACGFAVKSVDAANGLVTASTGMSAKSFGENLTVLLRALPDGAIRITFDSSLRFGVVAWGKNGENRLRFFQTLVSGSAG